MWPSCYILNRLHFYFHFNEKWLSGDYISWFYCNICLDKIFILIHSRDCCEEEVDLLIRAQKISLKNVLSADYKSFPHLTSPSSFSTRQTMKNQIIFCTLIFGVCLVNGAILLHPFTMVIKKLDLYHIAMQVGRIRKG